MAVGVITLIAGMAAGAGPASASSGHPAAVTASAGHVAGPR
jgi:hypothetical protein